MSYQRLNKLLATVYPGWIDIVMQAINGMRRTLWKELHEQEICGHYRLASCDLPFRHLPVAAGAQPVCDSFVRHNGIVQREYFLSYPKEVIYEPKYGWAMTRSGELIVDSLPYTYYALLPGLKDYFAARFQKADLVKTRTVASLRDVGDKNYYHFYNDHLVKLAMLKKQGVDDEVPLLVSKVLFSKPFFQEALQRSGLGKRQWIVQDREYVLAETSHFVKTMPITRDYLDYVLEVLRAPRADPNRKRRLFIDRGKETGRCIANGEEIRSLLGELDFEVVKTDAMSLAEQMELFSQAGTVVGIHGAGLANIIFRAGAPLKVVEIFPPNNIPAMFYWTCCRFGFQYDAVVGEKKSWKRAELQEYAKIDFHVDPGKLRNAICSS